MKFFIRLFAEIIALISVIITAARVLNTEHPSIAGMILVAVCVVALAFRATAQSEAIKDDAVQRRRLEKAFVRAASEAGWPSLMKLYRDRKVATHYIRVPYQGPDGDFYFEFPLEEERLTEPIQISDLLSKEELEKFYAGEKDKEVNTDTAEE